MNRRLIALLLSTIMIFSFTSCGKEDTSSEDVGFIGGNLIEGDDVEYSETIGGNTDSNSNGNSGDKNQGSSNKDNNNKNNNSSTIVPKPQVELKKDADLGGREIRLGQWWAPGQYEPDIVTGEKLNATLKEVQILDYQALYASIAAGKPMVDIFCPRDAHTLSLAKKNMIIPLDTLGLDMTEEHWNPVGSEMSTVDNHVYSMVQAAVPQIRGLVLYNADILKGQDDLYTLQKNGKLSWAKFEEILKKYTVASGTTVSRYGIIPGANVSWFTQKILEANGVTVVSRTPNSYELKYGLQAKKNAAITALNFANRLMTTNGLAYDPTAAGWNTGVGLFASGKGVAIILDENQTSEIVIKARFEIGACLFPGGPDANHDLVSQSAFTDVVIPKGVAKPEEVALFWNERAKYAYAQRKPSDIIAGYDDNYPINGSGKGTATKYLELLNSRKYTYDYANVVGGDVSTTLVDAALGNKTPAAAIDAISGQINALIKDAWK